MNAQRHHPGIFLDLGNGVRSMARWAKNPAAKVLIFVHGFGGSPDGTWPDFPNLLSEEAQAAGYDLIFYGYHGFRADVTASADEFRDFLDTLGNSAADMINSNIRPEHARSSAFSYDEIVIVAHSLGAIISRLALLYAHNDNPKPRWLERVGLVLFAPAHLGADLAELVPRMLQACFGLAATIGLNLSVASWQGLVPDGETVAALIADTRTALAECRASGFPTGHLIARAVIFGSLENIVKQGRFCDDPNHRRRVPGAGHLAVCKPRRPRRLKPAEYLLDELR